MLSPEPDEKRERELLHLKVPRHSESTGSWLGRSASSLRSHRPRVSGSNPRPIWLRCHGSTTAKVTALSAPGPNTMRTTLR